MPVAPDFGAGSNFAQIWAIYIDFIDKIVALYSMCYPITLRPASNAEKPCTKYKTLALILFWL